MKFEGKWVKVEVLLDPVNLQLHLRVFDDDNFQHNWRITTT
jgi:hypothetical protein